MSAPEAASAEATVAPPMPEPMMTISGCFAMMTATSADALLALRIEEHRLVQVEGQPRVLAGRDAGIGAKASDDFLAAELRDRKGIGTGRLHHFDQALAFGQRAGVAVGAIRIGQRLRADAEDDLLAGIGGKDSLPGATGRCSGSPWPRASDTCRSLRRLRSSRSRGSSPASP